ncbi:MAG: CHAD domain-containing protein [Thalassobaculum sp.]|uniref:CHAD domain-containing protein n=1 Tax=Thalassobaculum sp. TaxID=2022740 RepID=UPI0032EBFFD1
MPSRTPEPQPRAAGARERPAVVTPLAAIADAVRGTLQADPEEMTTRRLRLLDTVDRRLARRGFRLEAEPAGDGEPEHWRLVSASGRTRAAADIAVPAPRLVDDLPQGPLRKALAPIVDIRGLQPSPWIAVVEHRAALRDTAGKIRCRLSARTASSTDPGERCSAVRVDALKGYRTDGDRIADRISRHFGWSPSAPDPLSVLATSLLPEPKGAAYPSVADAGLPAGLALRPVLQALLDTVEHRAAGVTADLDCEELHELRVAVRRSRAILTLLRSDQPEPELEHARGFFAWLGQVTGPTRDLDVHVLDWRAHRRRSPDQAADLEPLGRYLKAERDKAQAKLVRQLHSRRFRDGVRRWRRALDAGDDAWSRTDRARTPIGKLAGRRIRKLYRQVVEDGSAITPDSPAEELHALRKTMKKLRYVFEIGRDVYPAKPAAAVLRKLKELQQDLGEVQDTAVQAEALRRFGEIMGRTGAAGPVTLMAIGALAEDLEIRRAEARARFASVFAPVAKRRFGDRLRRLTRGKAGGGR